PQHEVFADVAAATHQRTHRLRRERRLALDDADAANGLHRRQPELCSGQDDSEHILWTLLERVWQELRNGKRLGQALCLLDGFWGDDSQLTRHGAGPPQRLTGSPTSAASVAAGQSR